MSKSRLISGKSKKRTGAALDTDRYDFLDVSNAEPDLGLPNVDDSVLIGNIDGTRFWVDITTYADDFKGFTGSVGFVGSQGDVGFVGSQGDVGFVGSKGEQGNFGGVTFDYTFDSSTVDAAPGTGKLRFNQTDITTSSAMFLQDTDDTNTNLDAYLTTIDASTSQLKGHVRISLKANSAQFAIFSINANSVNHGEYFSVPTSYVSGPSSTFSNNDDIIVTFARTGDKGDVGFVGSKGDTGFVGSQGDTGFVGSQGDVGSVGSQGDVGFVGSSGDTGFVGSQGDTGFVGSQGDVGFVGSQGDVGFVGSQGDVGFVGSQGDVGFVGSQGDTGFVGSQGDVGSVGSQGDTGFVGSQGDTGFVGSQGDVGAIGFTGSEGTSGSQGDTGSVGSQGDTGFVGSQGDTGFVGSQGDVGFVGSQGDIGFTGSIGFSGSEGQGLDPWYRISADYTASSGNRLIADTTGGSFTVTLPLNPAVGDYIQITDAGDFFLTSLIIDANGANIEGEPDDISVDIPGITIELIYDGVQWQITSTTGPQGEPGYTGSAGSGIDSITLLQSGNLTVLAGTVRWYAPYDLQIVSVKTRLKTAADSTVSIVINKNDVSAVNLSISANNTAGTEYTTPLSLLENDYLTVDVVTTGSSSAPGVDLYVSFKYQPV